MNPYRTPRDTKASAAIVVAAMLCYALVMSIAVCHPSGPGELSPARTQSPGPIEIHDLTRPDMTTRDQT